MTSRWVDVPRVLIDLCDDEEKTYTLPPDGPLDDLCDDEEKTDALPPDGRAGAGPLGAPAAQEVEHPPACSSRGRRRAPRAAARRWRAGGAVHAGAGVEPPGRVHPNARQDLMHGVMQRLRFRGTVRRLGRTRGVRKAWVKPTVLLVDVRACSCPAVADELPLETDHVWLKVGKQLADLQLLPGSVLEFDARVRWYKKARPIRFEVELTLVRFDFDFPVIRCGLVTTRRRGVHSGLAEWHRSRFRAEAARFEARSDPF
ncbi:unnamed protein product [Prorocentrum cordatum]|uniref:Uncharacterized protein n=1 Tax=Prorocentrum cordatum TaxID=2364126 RepID=A0ABN9TSV7_9DINO|nr:unnamed protein product [Polarella glacialis]